MTTTEPPKRQLYFINEIVEDLLRKYIWTGCTRIKLRDDISYTSSAPAHIAVNASGLIGPTIHYSTSLASSNTALSHMLT
jgi:hypothetical protein